MDDFYHFLHVIRQCLLDAYLRDFLSIVNCNKLNSSFYILLQTAKMVFVLSNSNVVQFCGEKPKPNASYRTYNHLSSSIPKFISNVIVCFTPVFMIIVSHFYTLKSKSFSIFTMFRKYEYNIENNFQCIK